MRKLLILFSLLLSFLGNSQETIQELLKTYNKENVPYISVQELAMPKTEAALLDSRELIEFETSHIQNAIHVGYNEFKIETVINQITDKTTTIVVYCSLGIRSEDIGEQLKKAGYTNVYNLFGGIFEWRNNDFKIFNDEGETDDVHAYSKEWSQWLLKGNKIYD
tara:strand:- start:1126 stop:1617 length:492 start_codon:yes stop_codon:yes gene_type:complete